MLGSDTGWHWVSASGFAQGLGAGSSARLSSRQPWHGCPSLLPLLDVHPLCHSASSSPSHTWWVLLCLVSNVFVGDLIYPAPCSFWLWTPPGFGAWKTQLLMSLAPHHVPDVSANNTRQNSEGSWECPGSVWFALRSSSAQSSFEHQHYQAIDVVVSCPHPLISWSLEIASCLRL